MPTSAARLCGCVVAAALCALPATAELGGDLRLYPFYLLEDPGLGRRHLELAIVRGKLQRYLKDGLRLEAHAVIELSSPPALTPAASVVRGQTRRFFDLDAVIEDGSEIRGVASVDRLNLRWDGRRASVAMGRQAVTWGVNYFWPVLDLFAPFAPERVDRDYKPGVDAVRVTVPLGSLSEVEGIVAIQGESFRDDFSAASLGRFHAGSTDFGYMVGHFHGDRVIGAFVAADVAGTGIRGEAAYTRADDESFGRSSPRSRFWRVSAGADRQLAPQATLSIEAHWNGFGTEDAGSYRRLADADRVRRGEVSSLGRAYTGVSLGWQLHPLWTLSGAVLHNWGDASTLLQPGAQLSLSDNSTLLLGAFVGMGKGTSPDAAAADPGLASEYGAVPVTLWASYKLFF